MIYLGWPSNFCENKKKYMISLYKLLSMTMVNVSITFSNFHLSSPNLFFFDIFLILSLSHHLSENPQQRRIQKLTKNLLMWWKMSSKCTLSLYSFITRFIWYSKYIYFLLFISSTSLFDLKSINLTFGYSIHTEICQMKEKDDKSRQMILFCYCWIFLCHLEE